MYNIGMGDALGISCPKRNPNFLTLKCKANAKD